MFVSRKRFNDLEQKVLRVENQFNEEIKESYKGGDKGIIFFWGDEPLEPVPTLKGKVDAIIKHLNLELIVKEATQRKVVARIKKK